MPLIGFLNDGVRTIGAVDGDAVRAIAPMDEFYGAPTFEPLVNATSLPLADIVHVPFVPVTSRIFCVGINYLSHAGESKDAAGIDLPTVPMVFGRWAQTLVVDGAPVPVPLNEGLDWEVELAVVIKNEVWAATEADALDHVLGYTAFNDLSARAKQLETRQFTLGKNADRSGPIGPVLMSPDEVGDPQNLRVTSRVNGETMQDSNTNLLIHSAARIIEYITDTVTLLPGDVIATGTPGGVGLGLTPPRYLNPGDIVEVEVENIGVLTNPIVRRGDLR